METWFPVEEELNSESNRDSLGPILNTLESENDKEDRDKVIRRNYCTKSLLEQTFENHFDSVWLAEGRAALDLWIDWMFFAGYR